MLRIFPLEPASPAVESPDEFEIVLGRLQLASLCFVGVVLLVVCSGGAYFAGKASGVGTTPIAAALDAAKPPSESVPAEPESGAFYVHVGTTDREPAMILTSDLRTRGFPSVAAPGSTPTTLRVLVGPYKTLQEFEAAKEAIASLVPAPFASAAGQAH